MSTAKPGNIQHPALTPAASVYRRPPVWSATLVALCAVLTVAGWLLLERSGGTVLFVAAYIAGGAVPAATAFAGLLRRQVGIDLLMIVAALGAAVIGDWTEGAVLLFLFSFSGALEAYAMYRTTRSIESLVRLRPREATLVRNGVDARVPIDSLEIGDLLRAHPGERFAVDGEVVEGDTWADEATLTGESRPVEKSPGSQVFAGTINGRGSVLARMTRAATDTTLDRIIRSVQEAQSVKTPGQRVVERWQQPYVLGVLAAATIAFVGAWLLHDSNVPDAFYHSMVLLVAASPCAVVASSPAVVLTAIARSARSGVLFKGGLHLEMLGQVDTIALDKTGTITVGKPAITGVWTPEGRQADALVALAAAVERRSEHHLAETILAEAERRGFSLAEVEEFENHIGLGVHAHVGGHWVGVGREELFAMHEITVPQPVAEAATRFRSAGQTALLVVAPGHGLAGVIAVADQTRPEAAAAFAELRNLGIQHIVMLTGDHRSVAEAVAKIVDVDDVFAELLPDQKVLQIRRLIDQGHKLAMVGDGVNDAPALATADLGIAMGGAGTDVALEVADVVLMRDDLTALPLAVWLSRRARQRVRQNLVFAFSVIGFLVASSFLGLPLWLGVVGHEGSTLLVVLNGLRIFWEKPRRPA